jgi:hypothetical protein
MAALAIVRIDAGAMNDLVLRGGLGFGRMHLDGPVAVHAANGIPAVAGDLGNGDFDPLPNFLVRDFVEAFFFAATHQALGHGADLQFVN